VPMAHCDSDDRTRQQTTQHVSEPFENPTDHQ
jgi:hypothetical protein